MEERHTDAPERQDRTDAKSRRLVKERGLEQEEGITESRRGSPAEPSDKPENHPPHPQDINDMAR